MRIGYFNCFSGAAGDMIVGACIDAGASVKHLLAELGKLALGDVELHIDKVVKNGIRATSFKPIIAGHCEGPADNHHNHHNHHNSHNHNHSHRDFASIRNIIEQAGLANSVARNAVGIFNKLANAEATVHGSTVDAIHFHEVGGADAIIDIVGSCVALESLGIEKVISSPLSIGSGTIKCAHGVLPVPAPATVELVKGVPLTPSGVTGELLTPTGAAVLTHFAIEYGPMPAITVESIGYGAGQRDIPGRPNVLRLTVGQAETQAADADEVYVLETNIDDASGELIGYVTECLLAEGALDVSCSAISMKHNRPGSLLRVICAVGDEARLEGVLFRESTTFGIRRYRCERRVLARKSRKVETRFGAIRIKTGMYDGNVVSEKAEFGNCLEAANRCGVSVKEVLAEVARVLGANDTMNA